MSTGSSDPEFAGGAGRKRRRSLRGEVGTTGARFGSPALRRSIEEQPPEQPKPPQRRRSLRGEVGATGARFGSAALRRSLDDQPDQPDDHRNGPPDDHQNGSPDDHQNGSPGGHPNDLPGRHPNGPLDETAPFEHLHDHGGPPSVPAGREPEPEPEPAVEEFSGPLVRPYAWTGGRTTSDHDLRLETLVSLEENGIAVAMRQSTAEQRSIVEMCANHPRSVAEVSALLSVPLGVARVMLGDLISMGVVAVHDNAAAPGGPDFTLLERVLVGLRRL
ncbi:DUF742 domain-containing protein [Saccharothrix hoggarensis]|uniref:DUF742 domain-containing protein n=1 Tax=Saccharothrix hoggarensis TaxID=913853 RepID=A0ABW3QQD9_9PSEU